MIDGVWLPQGSRDREAADPALEALKLLCGLNPQDRQSRQEGPFGLEYVVLRQSVFDKVEQSKAVPGKARHRADEEAAAATRT